MRLLEPVHIGRSSLQNRMAMAPMTRSRASVEGIVGDSTALYYAQRASAGLIISEAINISEQAIGSPFTPGLYTPDQIEAWKKVTRAVHEKGGTLYAQLWHTGRVGHSRVKNGALPVAPSAIAITGQQHFTMEGLKDYETPHALTVDEIQQIIQDYQQAASHAIEAGFDGVELHAAFGYLPNQFLADSSNERNDRYGGSIENQNRFVLEAMHAIVAAVGENRAAIRLSPTNTYNHITHRQPVEQFSALIEQLNALPLAYLHLMKVPYSPDQFPHYPTDVIETLGSLSKHPVIANCGYTRETGEAELARGIAQMISYGTLFLANPDLPQRFEMDSELNPVDGATMYGGGDRGYIDYPSLNA
jgi:N-ethylmaleimide reductase